MNKIVDNLILAYAALTVAIIVVAAAGIEGLIPISEPVMQALRVYFKAFVAIGFFGAGLLSFQHVRVVRRRRDKWEKLSRSLDSPDETPAHQ